MRTETATGSTRRRVVGAALGLAAAIWLLAAWHERAERVRRLELSCVGSTCSATVDGGSPLELSLPYARRGQRVGLYAYHPHEFDRPQWFRRLRVRGAGADGLQLDLPLLDGRWRGPGWIADRGWQAREGVGLGHRGSPGERSVAMLTRVSAREVHVVVDLVDALDAGLLFRATDPRNGFVLAVRPRHNDVLCFRLQDGRPGPILALAQLAPLRPARETLRLAGLLAEILWVGALPVLAAWLLWHRRRRGPAPAAPAVAGHAPTSWLVALTLVTLAALTAVATQFHGGIPHIADETAYLFQAKILARGQLWAPAPAAAEFFAHEHIVISAGRWFGKYPPLFPALLALGVLVGAPWIVNPLLGTGVAGVVYALTRELADWRWGAVAWLLTLSSPFFLVMGGSMMSHMATALFIGLFLWMMIRGLRRRSAACMGLAGAALGLALLARPYCAFLAALAGATYGAGCWLRAADRRRVAGLGLLALLAFLPAAGLYAAWTGALTGSPGTSAHALYDPHDTLGFGPDKGAGWLMTWGTWGHSPTKALRSIQHYLDYTSRHLLGWPGRASLALVLVPFLLGPSRREERLLLGVLLALVLGHALYWATQHLGYGARYWFAALPGLMTLATLGLRRLHAGAGARAARLTLAGLVVAAVVWNLAAYLPPKLAELPSYGGVSAELKRALERRPPGHAVVFVQTQGLLFNDGFFMNDPFLSSTTIFARDLGGRNDELLARYPEHDAYLWRGGKLEPWPRRSRVAVQADARR